MRTLKLLCDDPTDVFRDIINRKGGDRRGVLEKLVTEFLFAHFSYKIDRLHAIYPARLSDNQKEALLNCYNVETTAMLSLREKLLRLAGTRCPYCGINMPKTLDHY